MISAFAAILFWVGMVFNGKRLPCSRFLVSIVILKRSLDLLSSVLDHVQAWLCNTLFAFGPSPIR